MEQSDEEEDKMSQETINLVQQFVDWIAGG